MLDSNKIDLNEGKTTIHSYIVDVAKQESSFLYFILESNEGICFYSTLEHQEGDPNRKIVINVPTGLLTEFEQIMARLSQSITGIEIQAV